MRKPISIQELRTIGQPAEILGRQSAEHWAGRYMRRVSPYLTVAAHRAGFTPNTLTVSMALIGLLGAAAFSQPGLQWALVGAALIQVYLLVDCADGELARVLDSESRLGVFLDRVGHYFVEAALLTAYGYRLDALGMPDGLVIGLIGAVTVLLTKASGDLRPAASEFGGEERRARKTLKSLKGALGRVPLHRLPGAIESSLVMVGLAVIDELASVIPTAQSYGLRAIVIVSALLAVSRPIFIAITHERSK